MAVADLIVALVALSGIVGLAVLARRARATKRARSVTVSLVVDSTGARRQLADGRSEAAAWSALTLVEVVRTTVRTSDGADAFVLLEEHEDSGCLVPLGVGHDTLLLAELARLPGFDLRRFSEARSGKPPARTVVWERAG